MFESLKDRYLKGWVTDEQLKLYVDLKVITDKQMKDIIKSKEAAN